jgi:hypothetical protein
MACYIIRRNATDSIYSIRRNDTHAVIAFTKREQAYTYKKLMNEMTNPTHVENNWFLQRPKHKKAQQYNTLRVEKTTLELITRTCNITQLDLLIYDNANEYVHYPASKTVSDDIRFDLEMKYRYGA